MRKAKCMAIAMLAILAMTSCQNGNEETAGTYNENPNLKDKIIQNTGIYDIEFFNSIEELVSRADVIIIGEITSDSSTIRETLPTAAGESIEGELPSVLLTVSKVKIVDTLYGEAKSDVIELVQYTNSVSDPEIYKAYGNRAIFMLNKNNINDYMVPVSSSQAIFYIGEDKKIMTMSNNKEIAKYDNTDLDLLLRDIGSAVLSQKRVEMK